MADDLLGDGLCDLNYSDKEHAGSQQKTELVIISLLTLSLIMCPEHVQGCSFNAWMHFTSGAFIFFRVALNKYLLLICPLGYPSFLSLGSNVLFSPSVPLMKSKMPYLAYGFFCLLKVVTFNS